MDSVLHPSITCLPDSTDVYTVMNNVCMCRLGQTNLHQRTICKSSKSILSLIKHNFGEVKACISNLNRISRICRRPWIVVLSITMRNESWFMIIGHLLVFNGWLLFPPQQQPKTISYIDRSSITSSVYSSSDPQPHWRYLCWLLWMAVLLRLIGPIICVSALLGHSADPGRIEFLVVVVVVGG